MKFSDILCVTTRVKSYATKTFVQKHTHYYIKEFDLHSAEQYIAEGQKIEHRNQLGIRDCKEIFDMLKEGEEIYKISKIIGRHNKTIKRLIKTCETQEIKQLDNKKCAKCGKPLEYIHVLDLNNKKFNIRHYNLKKNVYYNAKKREKYKAFWEFCSNYLKKWWRNKLNQNMTKKAIKKSLQTLIDEFKRISKKPCPSLSQSYRHTYQGLISIKFMPILSKRGLKPKKLSRKPQNKKKTVGLSIEFRPDHINRRSSLNDFELDTVRFKRNSKTCILTLINIRTRMFYFIFSGTKSYEVADSLIALIKYHGLNIDSLTIDNGSENQMLNKVVKNIYYCHPYSSCEKGSIENAHRLLRRWFPKGREVAKQDIETCAFIGNEINNIVRHNIKEYPLPMSANEFHKLENKL